MGSSFARYFQPEDGFDPSAYLTPEERAQQRISDAYRSAADQHGPVAGFVSALGALKYAMPQQSQRPEPATVSGGSVVGLMPDQTNALLDRVQRQNEVDNQMWQHEQDNLRAEARAREGYVFRASEAERAQRAAQALEKKRIDNRFALENYKRSQPTTKPLPGMPGFAVSETLNPDTGMREPSIVKMQGADQLPEKWVDPDLHGTWITTYGPDGITPVKKFVHTTDSGVPIAPNPAGDPNDATRLNAINARAKFFAGYGRPDGTGGVIPLSPTEATAIAQAEYDGSNATTDVDYSGLVPVPKEATPRLGLGPNNTYQEIVPGAKGPDPKPAPTKPLLERVSNAVRDLKAAGKVDGSDFKTNMQALIDSGAFTEQDLLPIYKAEAESGNVWSAIKSFASGALDVVGAATTGQIGGPSAPAQAPAAPQGKTIVERRTAKDGTKMVKYSDGTIAPE